MVPTAIAVKRQSRHLKQVICGASICAILWPTHAIALRPSRHWDITYRAARQAGFSEPASRIIAAGATQADKYLWDTAAAHAQSESDENTGLPSETVETSVGQFLNYLRERVAIVESATRAGLDGEALFRLGYAVHATQDLSAHQGMTNIRHAQLDLGGNSPDLSPLAIERAERWTTELMEAMKNRLGSETWQRLSAYDAEPPNEIKREVSAFDRVGADASVSDFFRYAWNGRRRADNAELSRLWGSNDDLETIHERAVGIWTAKPSDSSDCRYWLEQVADTESSRREAEEYLAYQIRIQGSFINNARQAIAAWDELILKNKGRARESCPPNRIR